MESTYPSRLTIEIVTLGCILVVAVTPPVAAEYNPKLGRYMQRDPNKTQLPWLRPLLGMHVRVWSPPGSPQARNTLTG